MIAVINESAKTLSVVNVLVAIGVHVGFCVAHVVLPRARMTS
jgi:hypothetical protein